MRIAILGSVALPVPPPAQGGTEWIAYYQAQGLAELGHEVILFAAHGSKQGKYKLVEVGGGDTVIGMQNSKFKIQNDTAEIYVESSRQLRKENVYLAEVMQGLINYKDDYDLILNNMRGEAVFLPVAHLLNKPFMNVMHLPLFPQLAEIFRNYNTHIITISSVQRKNFPGLNYLATIYNCVDTEKYVVGDDSKKRDYLLMMGSITPHKNQEGAIRVARKSGMKLVLAGKVNDRKYYDKLSPEIDGEEIRWVGEMPFEDKLSLYQNAKAFIFPILWEEPFGLVMIEAMACGTPVVAYGNGAIPEVLVDGVTGFVIEESGGQISDFSIKKRGEEGLAEAIEKIKTMDDDEYKKMRENCRKYVEEKFSVEKIVKEYEKALEKVVE